MGIIILVMMHILFAINANVKALVIIAFMIIILLMMIELFIDE